MDSINRQQPEENRENLAGEKAIEKIRDLGEGACFFSTYKSTGEPCAVRPMAVQKVDDDGCLWFLSAIDSHKNEELAADSRVELFFKGSAHSDFLHLRGRATVSQDRAKIDELWDPIIKTWFTEGKDDPRITVIKVTPDEGYYWDTKHGNFVAGIKVMIGAMTGKTLDDSIEGRLAV